MNILSIGNSFSTDAQRYLHRIAKADDVELNTVNLFIGGCSLSHHYRNMLSDERAYTLEVNGENTGFNVSMKEALTNREWDVITIQQVSNEAPDYNTYQPYLNSIAEYIRKYAPKAKLALHQTWAYEQDSERLTKELGYSHHTDMFNDVKAAYEKAAEAINADFVIPSGALFEMMIEEDMATKLYRDTYHASIGLGRYALGLLWYTFITGNPVVDNMFFDTDSLITPQQIFIAKRCASKLLYEHQKILSGK